MNFCSFQCYSSQIYPLINLLIKYNGDSGLTNLNSKWWDPNKRHLVNHGALLNFQKKRCGHPTFSDRANSPSFSSLLELMFGQAQPYSNLNFWVALVGPICPALFVTPVEP